MPDFLDRAAGGTPRVDDRHRRLTESALRIVRKRLPLWSRHSSP
jgi:hypothetical protein